MCWGSEAGARLGSADTKAALSAVSPEIVTSGWEVVQNKVAPLSPLQQPLLNPVHLVTTVLLQAITGTGLVLMQLRGRRQMQRVGLTPSLFFRTEATGPVQQHQRRSTD